MHESFTLCKGDRWFASTGMNITSFRCPKNSVKCNIINWWQIISPKLSRETMAFASATGSLGKSSQSSFLLRKNALLSNKEKLVPLESIMHLKKFLLLIFNIAGSCPH